jgi:glyoxylase-like metal-dependent hydrolase (beta-lactamase superfamily II)
MDGARERDVKIGDIDVIPLSDGQFRLDGGAMFGVVPKTLWSRATQADELNRIPLALTPLLIRTAGLNVLVDAGVGDKLPEKLMNIYAVDRTPPLHRALESEGLTPSDIDVVLATHLHFDHAGGFTTSAGGPVRPAFPRARYLVRRGEWDDAIHPHARSRASYMPENYVPVQEAGLLEFIEEDGEVLPGVSVWRTGGHTQHHQVVKIDSQGTTGLYLADLVPTAAHLPEAWIMGYDLYPMDTLAAKARWLNEAARGGYVIFFEHDPVLTAGRLVGEEGRWHVEPIATRHT